MNLDEAETRLSQERAYLIAMEHAQNYPMVALTQGHVAHWEERVRTLRLQENGGWQPCVV